MEKEENFFYTYDGMVLRYVQRFVTWVEKKFHVTSFTLTQITIAIMICADFSHYMTLVMSEEQKGYAIFRLVLSVLFDSMIAFYAWASTLQSRREYAIYGSCDPQKNPLNGRQRITRVFTLFLMGPMILIQWICVFTLYAGRVSDIYHAISGTAFVVVWYFASSIPLPRPVYAHRADHDDVNVIDGQ